MKRCASIIRLRPNRLDEYMQYHTSVWPEILEAASKANIRNQTIFFRDGLLFRYFEYVGDNYEKDMATLASHPTVVEWQKIMTPMQEPLDTCGDGEWWANMEAVFHCD